MTNNRAATVKVGLLTMISLLVLITTVIWLRGRTLGGGQPFEIYYRDVDGLREGAPVQFMGIRVGFVDEVTPVSVDGRYRVKVKFTIIEKDIQVPKGTYVSLEQSGIIGEKFVELTPPRPDTLDMEYPERQPNIRPGLPIRVHFRDGWEQVGEVLNVEEIKVPQVFKKTPDYRYQIHYFINKPGYMPPERIDFTLKRDKEGDNFFAMADEDVLWAEAPPKDTFFTLDEPLRLKEFLEQQLASAEALKMTNERINKLLSDEAITTIQSTLKNSEKLTAEATDVLVQANKLFSSSAQDIKILVSSAQELTDSVVAVSHNVNELVGNPELKANIMKTVNSVEESTSALSELLNDPNLKVILSDAKVTSENAAELMKYLKATAVDNDLQGRLNESLTLLNGSLGKLSTVMGQLEEVSSDKDSIKSIIQDTRETSENLHKFSEKLNKRFLLFRLLF